MTSRRARLLARGRTPGIGASLLALLLALPSTPAHAQTRPDAASGYSPAQRRAVDALLARTTAQRNGFADQYGVSRRTLDAVAREVGLRNAGFTEARLLDVVQQLAGQARALREDNARLRGDIARVSDPALRDPALALLDQAQAALDDGRLADAEAAYAQVKALRWDESDAARAAWDNALDAEARTAELRQDYDRAEAIRLEAADRDIAEQKRAHLRTFEQLEAAALSRYREGETLGRRDAFDRAIQLFETRVLPLVPVAQYPDLWARAADKLGMVFQSLGARLGGKDGHDLLVRAVETHDAAAAFFSREKTPDQWANVKNNLGNDLFSLAKMSSGAQRAGLFRSAAEQYEAAATIYTEDRDPAAWAGAQHNLANVLMSEAEVLEPEQSIPLVQRVIRINESLLRVRTEKDMPDDWAATQNSLALAYSDLGHISSGEEAIRYLSRAVEAHEAALRVKTPERNPSDWAMTQNNLGAVLKALGVEKGGEEGAALVARAVAAYEAALRVRTERDAPAEWAMTQANLAAAFASQGYRKRGPEGIALVLKAIATYDAALRVVTFEAMPAGWANNRWNTSLAHEMLAELEPERAVAHYRDAEKADLDALKIYTPDYAPYEYNRAQQSLARIRFMLDRLGPGPLKVN